MTELKMEHVLIFLIVAFVLYHLMNRCGNGFRVGGQTIAVHDICNSDNDHQPPHIQWSEVEDVASRGDKKVFIHVLGCENAFLKGKNPRERCDNLSRCVKKRSSNGFRVGGQNSLPSDWVGGGNSPGTGGLAPKPLPSDWVGGGNSPGTGGLAPKSNCEAGCPLWLRNKLTSKKCGVPSSWMKQIPACQDCADEMKGATGRDPFN